MRSRSKSALGRLIAVGALAALLPSVPACKSSMYGTATLFVWNGTDSNAQVQVEGRTTGALSLAPHSGQAVDAAIAGPYTVHWSSGDKQRELKFDLKPESTAVVNIDAKSCLARTDISGMYQAGKERVRFLEAYDPQELLLTGNVISVFPGQPAPTERPRSAYAFQRLSDIPCDIVRKTGEITEYVRRQR